MGIGFILIIVLLATLLGLFARQALSNAEEPLDTGDSGHSAADTNDHSHAI